MKLVTKIINKPIYVKILRDDNYITYYSIFNPSSRSKLTTKEVRRHFTIQQLKSVLVSR